MVNNCGSSTQVVYSKTSDAIPWWWKVCYIVLCYIMLCAVYRMYSMTSNNYYSIGEKWIRTQTNELFVIQLRWFWSLWYWQNLLFLLLLGRGLECNTFLRWIFCEVTRNSVWWYCTRRNNSKSSPFSILCVANHCLLLPVYEILLLLDVSLRWLWWCTLME